MAHATITFIGGGNMAASLIGGLIADGWVADRIHVAEPDAARRQDLATRFGVHVTADNHDAAAAGNVVIMAVKPQVLPEVARDLAATVQRRQPLVLSIAAGIREADLGHWLGGGLPVIRCMPNTPALIRAGASALYANEAVTDDQKQLAEALLGAVGLTVFVDDEGLMDAVTAVSGSGPAYVFLLIEALEDAGIAQGLPPDAARRLVAQTVLGAARMTMESGEDAATLRRRVSSPGGTTEQALGVLEAGGLRALLNDAVAAATRRARELAQQAGQQ